MIWRIVSFGLVLWIVQYEFHLPAAMTVLLGIAVLTVLVGIQIRTSHRLTDASRKI